VKGLERSLIRASRDSKGPSPTCSQTGEGGRCFSREDRLRRSKAHFSGGVEKKTAVLSDIGKWPQDKGITKKNEKGLCHETL